MSDENWEALVGRTYANEAEVNSHFVEPLLRLLGYGADDIAPSHPVVFQEGRKGRPNEADYAIFNGRGREIEDCLLVVETKASTERLESAVLQANSYAFNLGAPILVVTNGLELQIHQVPAVGRAKVVLDIPVAELVSHKADIEATVARQAALNYKGSLARRSPLEVGFDLAAYIEAEARRVADVDVFDRRLVSGDKSNISIYELFDHFGRGCIVQAPSGFGKSTVARAMLKAELEIYPTSLSPACMIWLPDVFVRGARLLQFVVARLSAQCPTVSESVFAEILESCGATLICDGLDRVSPGQAQQVASEIRLLLQDYPKLRVVVFGRTANLPDCPVPTLALQPLNEGERRDLGVSLIGQELWSQFSYAVPDSFEPLIQTPLLLVRLLKQYEKNGKISTNFKELFDFWLFDLLAPGGIQESRHIAKLRQAFGEVAWGTRTGPISADGAAKRIEDSGLSPSLYEELEALGCLSINQFSIEVVHESLADYFRVPRILESQSLLDETLQNLEANADGFLPILLISMATTEDSKGLIWEAIDRCGLKLLLRCLDFSVEIKDVAAMSDPAAETLRVLREYAWGLEAVLRKFPSLWLAAVRSICGDRQATGLRLFGSYSPVSFCVQFDSAESGIEVSGEPAERGRRNSSSYGLSVMGCGTEAIRRLGAEKAFNVLCELFKSRHLEGGIVFVEERLLSTIMQFEKFFGTPIFSTTEFDLEALKSEYQEHINEYVEATWNRRVYFEDAIRDVEFLQANGLTHVRKWWMDFLDPTTLEPVDENALKQIFELWNERTVLAYKELCEKSMSLHLGRLSMYRALPVRWQVQLSFLPHVYKAPNAKFGRVSADVCWWPVSSENESGTDVYLPDKEVDEIDGDFLIEELERLNRRGDTSLMTSNGYSQNTFHCAPSVTPNLPESVVLADASSLVLEDLKSLFKGL